MSSTPKSLKATTKTRRGLRRCPRVRRSSKNEGGSKTVKCTSKVVSAKLETLKNLVPNGKSCSGEVQADKLFQETADYIVLLRTQVVVLQKLIEVYGSSSACEKNEDNN